MIKAGAGGDWQRLDEKFDARIVKQTDLSCVSAVGEMLLKQRGIVVPQSEIRDIIGVPSYFEALARYLNKFDSTDDGKTWLDFVTNLESLGLLLRQNTVGVILREPFSRIGHAIHIIEITRDGLLQVQDSFDQTSYKMTAEVFDLYWGGEIIARWYPRNQS